MNSNLESCMVVENNVITGKEVGKCIDNTKDAQTCNGVSEILEDNRCVVTNITTSDACDGGKVWEYNHTTKESCHNASNRRWHTHSKYYENVTGDICVTEETGDLGNFWDHNNKNNSYSRYGSDKSLSYYERNEDGSIRGELSSQYKNQFVVRNFRCTPTETTSSGDSWTEENSSLAKVNIATKSLDIISEPFEKALRVWVIGDNLIYSSRDSKQGA